MASKIIFEEDIDPSIDIINGYELHKEMKIKCEGSMNEDICTPLPGEDSKGFTDSNWDVANTEQRKNKDIVILENVIILGSRVPKGKETQNELEGNTSLDEGTASLDEGNNSHGEGNTSQDESNTIQDESNISQDEGNISQDEGNYGNVTLIGKVKPKRKLKSELELLLLDIKKTDNDIDGEYDAFEDENKLFRKYKLRKTETVSYKEPADIKLDIADTNANDETRTCPVCKQKFENKRALFKHLRIHNKSIRKHTCSLCSKIFDCNADLIAHRETHSGESFLCQECELAFSSYSDYLLHNYEHLNQPHFKCSECGLRFRKSIYKQHIMTHFNNKFPCDLCPFVASNETILKTHLNEHNKKFTCIECGKVCKEKSHFEYHMSVHTGVKKWQCLYCGAGFRIKQGRDVHTRTHTGEKPFTCDICGHKSRQWIDLRRHKETHGTENRHICDVCGKKYRNKEYLVSHMRCHTKKSLYECPECDATFVSMSGLKCHSMLKHTSERPVECKLCDKKFISDNQYRKHCRAKYHLRNVYGNNMSVETTQ